jgi:hypothetical protein
MTQKLVGDDRAIVRLESGGADGLAAPFLQLFDICMSYYLFQPLKIH